MTIVVSFQSLYKTLSSQQLLKSQQVCAIIYATADYTCCRDTASSNSFKLDKKLDTLNDNTYVNNSKTYNLIISCVLCMI